jgi:catechol 2,3-dioxygenase
MSQTASQPAAQNAQERPVIKPTLHHYGVMTSRIDEMIEWYAKVVGHEVTSYSKSPIPSAYVTNDGAHHRSGFFTPPVLNDPPTRPAPGVGHVAYEYQTIDDLLESWQRLKDIGIEALVMTCHGTHYAFYYKDPDGNIVELDADAFGDWEKSRAYIGLDVYAQNPMGPAVDPAQLIEARKNGTSLDDLREQTMAGKYTPATYNGPEVLM